MGAFNGSGTFVRTYNWVTDKTNSVNITASRMDTEDDGFAAGLTLCVTRDGQGKMAADYLPSSDNTYNLGTAIARWASFNGIAYTDFSRLSTVNTFTAAQSVSGYPIMLSSATPGIALKETDAAANNQVWDIIAVAEQLRFRVVDDAIGTAVDWLEVDRTLNVVDTVNMKGTSVAVNGTPINVLAAFKAAATSRNTTTTFASDPDLAFSNVPAGTYEIELALFFDGTTATGSNGGFKAQLAFSGTVGNGVLAPWGSNGTNTMQSLGYQSFAAGVINIATMSSASATATQNWFMARGTVTLNNTQNVALQWAQSNSDSDNTTLQLMSRLTLRRIA